MLRSIYPEEPSPNRYIYIMVLASMTQKTLWKKSKKDHNSQNTRKPNVKQSLLKMTTQTSLEQWQISGHDSMKGGHLMGFHC